MLPSRTVERATANGLTLDVTVGLVGENVGRLTTQISWLNEFPHVLSDGGDTVGYRALKNARWLAFALQP